MKQAPLFRRQFFIQRPAPDVANTEAGAAIEYVRIHGNPANPGQVLNGQRVRLTQGGMLDVVAEARNGDGLGRVAYGPGLRAGLKRGEEVYTYRFEVPSGAAEGDSYSVSVWGSDMQPAFRFTIEVGKR